MGGKRAIAKPIANILNSLRNGKDFLEPFCGGLWVTAEVTGGIRRASDISQPLITLYQAMQQGWTPPDALSEEKYLELKSKKDPNDPMTAFAGYGCSFSGKYFRGYARSKVGGGARNYALGTKKSLTAKLELCKDVIFSCNDFRDWDPQNQLIYCDPPYYGTTMYPGTGEWDSDAFWKVMTEWSHPSRNNIVIISEYKAPSNFQEIASFPCQTSVRTKDKVPRVEKLFRQGTYQDGGGETYSKSDGYHVWRQGEK